jgi:hypothetical protein
MHQRDKIEQEISEMLDGKRQAYLKQGDKAAPGMKQRDQRHLAFDNNLNLASSGNDLLTPNQRMGYSQNNINKSGSQITTQQDYQGAQPYETGQLIGASLNRSQKLKYDPTIELKHVTGFTPMKC